jgi:hypothetical protein
MVPTTAKKDRPVVFWRAGNVVVVVVGWTKPNFLCSRGRGGRFIGHEESRGVGVNGTELGQRLNRYSYIIHTCLVDGRRWPMAKLGLLRVLV